MPNLIENEALSKELRKRVRTWAKEKEHNFLYQIARLGLIDTGELYESLKSKTRTNRDGFTDKITYSFERQGILQQLGWTWQGQGKAKPWISEALNSQDMNELAEIVADIIGDETIDTINTIAPLK